MVLVLKSVLATSILCANLATYQNPMTPERKSKLLQVLNKRQAGLTVVMENVHDPHNISAVMRTCEAAGIQDVYVLTTIISRHKRFGVKSSSSAAKWLTIHQHTEAKSCFKELRSNYDLILTTHLASDAIDLYAIDFTKKIALVFGNEHDGVSEEIRSLADGNFVIPQVGIIQSLNISVACAVAIYEAYRQRSAKGMYEANTFTKEKQHALLKNWGFTEKDIL